MGHEAGSEESRETSREEEEESRVRRRSGREPEEIMSGNVRPLIFLDIDGVLVCANSAHVRMPTTSHLQIDPWHLKRFTELVEETGAEVVISSTWRVFYGLEGMKKILGDAGFVHPDRVISITPNFGKASGITHFMPRRKEIERWLVDHVDPESPRPFIILDDEEDAGIEGHFVQCSWTWGFTQAKLEEALALLKEQMT